MQDARVKLVAEQRMVEHGLLGDRAPGLVINGRLVWAGSVPERELISEWLRAALAVEAA